MAFELPKLNYATNALEPHIDARTMEIHHGKHHQAYVTNLNNAITGTDAEKMSIEDICKNISKYPAAVRNNGGGHYNHSLFWQVMAPNAGGTPTGDLAKAEKTSSKQPVWGLTPLQLSLRPERTIARQRRHVIFYSRRRKRQCLSGHRRPVVREARRDIVPVVLRGVGQKRRNQAGRQLEAGGFLG